MSQTTGEAVTAPTALSSDPVAQEQPQPGTAPAEHHTTGDRDDDEAQEVQDPLHLIDSADRSIALKHWSQAADEYAQALSSLREQHEEDAPQLAPVLHRYGRSLLEHAIATSGALGGGGSGGAQQDAPMPSRKKAKKEQGNAQASSSSSSSKPADPRFSFSGDAEDEEEGEEEEEGDEDQGREGGEPEDDADDLSVAFFVLDLARVIYQKLLRPSTQGSADTSQAKEDPSAHLITLQGQEWDLIRIKNELAEVLNDLGDVGLESENFQQASSDYESSLQLLSPLLHPHSRRLADAYLRLGLALEFHPEPTRQASASNFIESAANALRTRLDALQSRSEVLSKSDGHAQGVEARQQAAAAQLREEKAQEESIESAAAASRDGPANAKAPAAASEHQHIAEPDDVAGMDDVRVERELKDVREMIAELEAKLEDIKANQTADSAAGGPSAGASSTSAAQPAEGAAAAKAALQQAINDAFLGASTNSLADPARPAHTGPVNDLSAMVKKKKRPVDVASDAAAEGGKGKGKATDASADGVPAENDGGSSKRAKVDDA